MSGDAAGERPAPSVRPRRLHVHRTRRSHPVTARCHRAEIKRRERVGRRPRRAALSRRELVVCVADEYCWHLKTSRQDEDHIDFCLAEEDDAARPHGCFAARRTMGPFMSTGIGVARWLRGSVGVLLVGLVCLTGAEAASGPRWRIEPSPSVVGEGSGLLACHASRRMRALRLGASATEGRGWCSSIVHVGLGRGTATHEGSSVGALTAFVRVRTLAWRWGNCLTPTLVW